MHFRLRRSLKQGCGPASGCFGRNQKCVLKNVESGFGLNIKILNSSKLKLFFQYIFDLIILKYKIQ